MFMKKRQKQIERVEVTLTEEKYSGDEPTTKVKVFHVPEGGKCSIETICGDFKIFDRDGLLVKHVNWQAGFTQEYEFFYTVKK